MTGQTCRQFSHTIREETGKIVVEFTDDIVTALEESESEEGSGRVKIVVPPIVIAW